jgi:hypothetical protein
MNDLSIYFSPLPEEDVNYEGEQIGQIIISNFGEFPEIASKSIALFSVPEFRGNADHKNNDSRSEFRSKLKQLSRSKNWNSTIYDLGTIIPGEELKDTYFAISSVVHELIKNNVVPILIGGSQDLVLAAYDAYAKLEQLVNICSIDHSLDIGGPEVAISHNAYLTSLLLKRPCYLFNHANIGLQIPYAQPKELKLVESLYFDVCRLGEFNDDFKRAEPHLRNADVINLDFNSIKASDVFSHKANPNGFQAQQICQISRYAGISDKVNFFGVFNYIDFNEMSDKLLSEILWYFIDGYQSRWGDFPVSSKAGYFKFNVELENGNHSIVFYKSHKSDRWWMEVPYPPQKGSKYERHHLVPCDKEDYDRAMQNEMPDLWWKTYQKLT